jgi:GT2 family glycosyltransferase
MTGIGTVIIGRNEGERLRRCLQSVVSNEECQGAPIVYVDSGSSDGSVEQARSFGAHVVELELTLPFTMARGRNAGFNRMLELCPGAELVQFVDGDCELARGWISRARQEIEASPDVAVVCGRRRERFPDASRYNRLCDMEWDTPVGDAEYCGGDALIRAAVFCEVGGFRESMIAGEEPEMQLRMRQRGWRVRRIDAEMTLHDAAMTRFGQWWKRSVRAGHAFAEVTWLHRAAPLRLWRREIRSAWFWGLGVPTAVLAVLPFFPLVSLVLLLGYGALWLRIYRAQRRRYSSRDARLYAIFCVLAKFAEVAGNLLYHRNRLRGHRPTLIEYKGPETVGAGGRGLPDVFAGTPGDVTDRLRNGPKGKAAIG